jgi:hypothetical protein
MSMNYVDISNSYKSSNQVEVAAIGKNFAGLIPASPPLYGAVHG